MYSSSTIPLITWLLSSTSIVVNGQSAEHCKSLSNQCKNGIVNGKKKGQFACTKFLLLDCSKIETGPKCALLCSKEDEDVDPIPANGNMQSIVASYINGDDDVQTTYGNEINCWDTSRVESFANAFYGQTSFNERLDCWDVSSATSVHAMFDGANSFDQDLNTWDVSRVEAFSGMFYEASSFNQDIGDWDVSSGTNFEYMFDRTSTSSFNQDLSTWDISEGANIVGLFRWTAVPTAVPTAKPTAVTTAVPNEEPSAFPTPAVGTDGWTGDRRLGSSNNNNNNDNNNNHNDNHILQEDGLGAGAGAGMDDDIAVFAPFEMVDDNIHQATDNDN